MQHKSVNNVAMESKAYNLLKQIKEINADHIYCNPSQLLENENNKKETINNLKSMLILHLEVVKEQADQLLNKDKLIAKLKQENDELKSRLEKYEYRRNQHQAKRMSLSKKALPTTTEAESIAMVVEPTIKTTNNNNINNKKTKGRLSSGNVISSENIESDRLNDVCNNSDNTATLAYSNCLPPADVEKTPSYKRRKIDRKSQSEKTPVKDQSKTSLPVDPYEFTIDETSNPQEQLREPTCTEPVEDKTEDKKKSSKNAFITSKSEYILCDWQKSEAELDADMEPHVRASLEIPSWSIKERNQLVYSIEGTENMTDEIFLKRHAKFETDERRRKKWDVQRLREQKQIERLKKRYLKDEYEDQDHLKLESKTITSFYPSPENIQYIQIVEELPVLAFGEPIPSIPEADFSLPWLTNKDKSNMSPTTCFTKTRFFSKKK